MSSRHRFLKRSITNVSFHNRVTEEDSMWRRREHERSKPEDNKQRYRSRSPHEKQKRHSRKHRSSNDESKKPDSNNEIEAEFGPPLPANLGINADRWDHAFFMQRYPKEYEKQVNKPKREESTSSEDERQKKEHHRHRKINEDNKKKSKRRHRSRS